MLNGIILENDGFGTSISEWVLCASGAIYTRYMVLYVYVLKMSFFCKENKYSDG